MGYNEATNLGNLGAISHFIAGFTYSGKQFVESLYIKSYGLCFHCCAICTLVYNCSMA